MKTFTAGRTMIATLITAVIATQSAMAGHLLAAGDYDGEAGYLTAPDTVTNWPAENWFALKNVEGKWTTAPVNVNVLRYPDGRVAAVNSSADGGWLVHGTGLTSGTIPSVTFKRGELMPHLGRPYLLSYGDNAFVMTLGKWAAGGLIAIEQNGEKIEYAFRAHIAEGAVIRFAGDLDGDNKPDIIVEHEGTTSMFLSREAKPGRNFTTAVLMQALGC